jgi:H+-transporting ATPase
MQSFLTYRVSATLQLVFFFFIAVFALPPYTYGVVGRDTEFFHLPVLMFMLITLLNDGTLMSIGYDNVVPNLRPMKWNLPCLFFIAAVLAGVACVSSLMLLWMELDAHLHRVSWYSSMHLPRLHYDQIVTSIYLKISISDFLTLFAGRTGTKPFFAVAPGKVLLWGAIGSLTLSTLVATFWPASSPDHVNTRGLWYNPAEYAEASYKYKLMPLFVWGYCVTWWFIQDMVKVIVYIIIEHFDIFSFRSLADPDANRASDCARVSGGEGEKEKLLAGQQTPGDYASGGITHVSGSGYGAAGNTGSINSKEQLSK